MAGHRFSSVLGLNKYQSPFAAWSEIVKLAKLPFVDNKFTIAGKTLEPKIIEYISTKLPNVMSMEDYYGNIVEEYRYNNFKNDSDRFGGVFDAVCTLNDKTTISAIIECKTSQSPQNWANGNVPVEYLCQGALYSYLKGLKEVIFVCTFLKENQYAHPEEVDVNENNTIIVIKKLDDMLFEVDGEYLNIEGCIQKASKWWDDYVLTGVSPEFDEVKDKEYLDIIRATDATKDNELDDVCDQAFALYKEIEELKVTSGLTAKEKQLKQLEESIKNKMIELDTPTCGNYKLSKTSKAKFNEKKFAEEQTSIYEQYLEETTSYTLRKGKGE
jgi:predicted phage-related endonuclease